MWTYLSALWALASGYIHKTLLHSKWYIYHIHLLSMVYILHITYSYACIHVFYIFILPICLDCGSNSGLSLKSNNSIIQNQTIYRTVGENITLDCLAIGVQDEWPFYWYLNGTEYSPSDDRISTSFKMIKECQASSSLTLTDLTYNDSGEYRCEYETISQPIYSTLIVIPYHSLHHSNRKLYSSPLFILKTKKGFI